MTSGHEELTMTNCCTEEGVPTCKRFMLNWMMQKFDANNSAALAHLTSVPLMPQAAANAASTRAAGPLRQLLPDAAALLAARWWRQQGK
jgi:hypothetical protein